MQAGYGQSAADVLANRGRDGSVETLWAGARLVCGSAEGVRAPAGVGGLWDSAVHAGRALGSLLSGQAMAARSQRACLFWECGQGRASFDDLPPHTADPPRDSLKCPESPFLLRSSSSALHLESLRGEMLEGLLSSRAVHI